MRESAQSLTNNDVRLYAVTNQKNVAGDSQHIGTLVPDASTLVRPVSPASRGWEHQEEGPGYFAPGPQETNPGRVARCRLPTCFGGRNGHV